MKLNAFTNPLIYTARSAAGKTSTAHRTRLAADEHDGDHEAAERLQISRRPTASPCRSSVNPSKPKAATANAKTTPIAPPDQPSGNEQPGGDRDPAAAGS